ncbi:MAG: histidine kinase dimerization/phosphoacceptor domain -containing protein [Planctomycetota bacterium]
MSLRLRLTLAILSVVALMGTVGLVSYQLNRRIQSDVGRLDRTREVSLDSPAVVGRALSIEGRWQDGEFVAERVERLAANRRPKLRGALASVELDPPAITLYGQHIGITAETQYDDGADPSRARRELQPGARVEVSCKIEPDGSWTARKIEQRNVKKSDKVKGMITAVLPGTGAGRTLHIDGLSIHAPPQLSVHIPRGPLYRLQCATQMSLAVQECLTAANELLKERYRGNELTARGELDVSDRHGMVIKDVKDRIVDGCTGFAQYLAESRDAEAAERLPVGEPSARSERLASYLAPLEDRRLELEQRVGQFVKLSDTDLEAAERHLKEALEPFLRTEVMSRVHAYALATEEDLSDEMAAISSRSDAAARLELVTNGAGFLLALMLGLIVSRSIVKPIGALESAARRIGSGQLDTRVAVTTQDEIGVLAATFNRMAEELAQSTVSVTNLRQVQDELRTSLQEKDLLLHEVHHRVKNNLQVISSLLALQSHSITDPIALARFEECQDLIQAIVFAHEQLHRSQDQGHVDLRSYLELLTNTLEQSHTVGRHGIRMRVQVDELSLDVDRAQLCGLIVSELVTNSFKHAFGKRDAGEIKVTCNAGDGARIVLEVADDGSGFVHDFTRSNGNSIGLSLVSLLTGQLNGQLLFDGRQGAAYRIEFPLEAS